MTIIKYIQRKRTKGWRLDDECKKLGIKREDVVYCGRGSKWGNPFVVGGRYFNSETKTKEEAVFAYEDHLLNVGAKDYIEFIIKDIKKALKGKTLMCWCSREDFDNDLCHCSVLYKIANEE